MWINAINRTTFMFGKYHCVQHDRKSSMLHDTELEGWEIWWV